MVAQLIHEVIHIKQDKNEKIVTTAVFLGEKNIKKLCYLLLFSVFIAAFYLFSIKIVNIIFVLATSIFVIFFIYKISRGKIDLDLRRMYKNYGILVGIVYLLSIIVVL